VQADYLNHLIRRRRSYCHSHSRSLHRFPGPLPAPPPPARPLRRPLKAPLHPPLPPPAYLGHFLRLLLVRLLRPLRKAALPTPTATATASLGPLRRPSARSPTASPSQSTSATSTATASVSGTPLDGALHADLLHCCCCCCCCCRDLGGEVPPASSPFPLLSVLTSDSQPPFRPAPVARPLPRLCERRDPACGCEGCVLCVAAGGSHPSPSSSIGVYVAVAVAGSGAPAAVPCRALGLPLTSSTASPLLRHQCVFPCPSGRRGHCGRALRSSSSSSSSSRCDAAGALLQPQLQLECRITAAPPSAPRPSRAHPSRCPSPPHSGRCGTTPS